MKREHSVIKILCIAGILAACAFQGASVAVAEPIPEAVSAASESGWSVSLAGVRSAALYQGAFEELKLLPGAYVERKADRKGVAFAYKGVPLRFIIAMVDGPDAKAPFAFDQAAWKAGYDITLVAKDGYSVTFSTRDLAPDALILADSENGQGVAPLTVGDAPRNLWVKDLVAIRTSLAANKASQEAASFSLELAVNGSKASHTLAELEKLPLYREARGAYTTSAGTRYEGLYGGVSLLGLLRTWGSVAPDDSITFTATDGYEMSYSGAQVLDQKDGEWILAFKLDGEYLPPDPGYVRTIKVGPSVPNIDGHLSVRMVKRIALKEKDFKDFTVLAKGKMRFTLDRSTLQSCASCHAKTVTFERKGESAQYSGFPLWLLLGYVDDPAYAPHKQDKSIAAYDRKAALAGYGIELKAGDGFSLKLDSREVDHNDDLILAMKKGGERLPEGEAPLVLVWDRNAKLIPANVKNVKNIVSVEAVF